ncbi:GPW/gp25 family protein [Spartinivicinus ruber]|uniref:GPW/gp25 family protein n=1 Tax=Spartinivicinus ruber TaxID=2683272 RepID=UPI0013D55980|nr:GPW/gp25 family protein [Spartinivicinus ruber]
MHGIDRVTGKRLKGHAHLKQSIQDILTTPIGSRIMRRDYGSRLFELIDAPINPETITDIYAATAEALDRWEPRFRLEQIQVHDIRGGQITVTLSGEYRPDGQLITLEGLIL